jgi:ElaB/YqjD/DUF883 family membrane-anchored ribosome-binding protein
MTSESGKSGKTTHEETPVTDTARKYASEAIETASQKAGELERKLRAESERLGGRVDATRREANQQFDDTLATAEDYIRKEPVKAAGIAFAAGVLAALVLRR